MFVLGMHRSGTSAVTRAINLLGVPLNVRTDWLPGTPQGNPLGYWESASLLHLNDELLATLDGTWKEPPQLDQGWSGDARLDAVRVKAIRACDAVFLTEQWVWKDPRNCLTLPFWLDTLDVAPAIVLVHRSPVEVALSLLRRDALPINHSLALWERYIRTSIEAAAGLPTYVLDYARLLYEPLALAADLQRFLELVGFRVTDPDEAELRSFLSSELRHSRFPDPETWPQFGVTPEQRALHADLSSAAGAHQCLALSTGDETLATEALIRSLRNHREAARVLERTARSVAEAQEQIAGLNVAQPLLESRLDAKTKALEVLEAHIAELDARHEADAAEVAALAGEVANLRDHTAALRHRLDAVERSTLLRLLTAPGRARDRLRHRDRAELPVAMTSAP